MINVCVPVLNRYDLLAQLIRSLEASDVQPNAVYVIDNGGRGSIPRSSLAIEVKSPRHRMGLAESWNWFIDNVSEERLITNDDIEFAPHSISALVASKAPFVSCGHGFSCFLLRDECVQKVGPFDESLSPGYAYFEDMDYFKRMKLADVIDEVVHCDVLHKSSQTPAKYSPVEWEEHHDRFNQAATNFRRKWKRNPNWDDLRQIGGAGANQ